MTEVERDYMANLAPLREMAQQRPRMLTPHEQRRDAFLAHPEKVRVWSSHEVLDEIARIVGWKDTKAFAGEDEAYAERWLLIHTSEPFVDWSNFTRELQSRLFSPNQFDSIYFIRCYEPATRDYPWWRVHPRSAD